MNSWISSDSEFADFCAALPDAAPVALDTEFAWSFFFFSCFALLQLGICRKQTAIVVFFAVSDWRPLSKILSDTARCKVCFSAANDLPILRRAAGGTLPSNIFDVQLAAAFCGEAANQSLKAIIESRLGISLAKSETRSDWTLRPLSSKQIEYAADDVALLPELAAYYSEQLRNNDNMRFFLEESETRYCVAEAYELTPPEDAWKRLSGIRKMNDAISRRRAIALAIWRERTARQKDIARPRVLSDEQLYWCAYEKPSTEAALLKMPDCWPKRVKPFASEILAVLSGPLAEEPKEPAWEPVPKERHKALTERVLGFVRKHAQERGIDATIAVTRHDAESFATSVIRREKPTSRLVRGWRGELFGKGLEALK
ncbi:MAG: HRDC domain-containing protein [Lentisphaeria bacterium]|nr:HRDC domain-containing protein [Lentisphaeria bacterium]